MVDTNDYGLWPSVRVCDDEKKINIIKDQVSELLGLRLKSRFHDLVAKLSL